MERARGLRDLGGAARIAHLAHGRGELDGTFEVRGVESVFARPEAGLGEEVLRLDAVAKLAGGGLVGTAAHGVEHLLFGGREVRHGTGPEQRAPEDRYGCGKAEGAKRHGDPHCVRVRCRARAFKISLTSLKKHG